MTCPASNKTCQPAPVGDFSRLLSPFLPLNFGRLAAVRSLTQENWSMAEQADDKGPERN
jgi:hypothetical protein